MSKKCWAKGEAEIGNGKTKLDNARNLQGFFDLEDKEFEEIMRNVRKWLPLCFARHARRARMGRRVARLMISSQIGNSTPHTSHFLVESQWRTWLKAQIWRTQHTFRLMLCVWFSTTLPSSSCCLSSLLSSCSSTWPSASSSTMWRTNTLCTLVNQDLGTLAENEPPTCYKPNGHFIAEANVEYTQESSDEQRYPDDFDYGDVTIGKTFLDACRSRAYHSQHEGLSSSQSSYVCHGTGRLVVEAQFDSLISNVRENPRRSSEK